MNPELKGADITVSLLANHPGTWQTKARQLEQELQQVKEDVKEAQLKLELQQRRNVLAMEELARQATSAESQLSQWQECAKRMNALLIRLYNNPTSSIGYHEVKELMDGYNQLNQEQK